MVKNPPANAGDASLAPELGTYPEGRNGNPLQYPCLGNPMNRKAWWAIVHRVTKSRARPNDWTRRHMHLSLSCGFLFYIYFEVLALVWRNTPGMINSFHKEREINTSHKVNHEVYFLRKLHYFKSRVFFFIFILRARPARLPLQLSHVTAVPAITHGQQEQGRAGDVSPHHQA